MSARDHLPEMIEAYASGLTMSEIGARFGITRSRVQQLFAEAKVPVRPGLGVWAQLSPERREEVREILRARMAHLKGKILVPELERAVELVRGGASYGEAARALGITRNAVAGACHRNKIKSARKQRGGHNHRVYDWPTLLRGAAERNLCAAHLAREIGTTCGVVRRASERHGIALRDGVVGIAPKDRGYRVRA